jgi:non-heme chloroperoxidase
LKGNAPSATHYRWCMKKSAGEESFVRDIFRNEPTHDRHGMCRTGSEGVLRTRLLTVAIVLLIVHALSSPAFAAGKPGQKKPTLVMIHGMFVGPWCWNDFKAYFEQRGYTCRTLTLRYHDTPLGSPPDSGLGATSLFDYVADAEAEIKTLKEKPVIIGHSMGGLIAQILGSRGLARSLVLISPAAPRGINAVTWRALKSAWHNRSRIALWGKPMSPSFEGVAYSSLHLLPYEEQKKVFEKFTYESGRVAWEIGFWFFDFKKATRVDESGVTCPVLMVVGTEDRLTPPSVVKKIHEKYARVSTYKEFPNHSHWIIAEPDWEEAADFIHSWMQRSTAN